MPPRRERPACAPQAHSFVVAAAPRGATLRCRSSARGGGSAKVPRTESDGAAQVVVDAAGERVPGGAQGHVPAPAEDPCAALSHFPRSPRCSSRVDRRGCGRDRVRGRSEGPEVVVPQHAVPKPVSRRKPRAAAGVTVAPVGLRPAAAFATIAAAFATIAAAAFATAAAAGAARVANPGPLVVLVQEDEAAAAALQAQRRPGRRRRVRRCPRNRSTGHFHAQPLQAEGAARWRAGARAGAGGEPAAVLDGVVLWVEAGRGVSVDHHEPGRSHRHRGHAARVRAAARSVGIWRKQRGKRGQGSDSSAATR